MAERIKEGQFWIDHKDEVYEVFSVKRGEIVVHHTWKKLAWSYNSTTTFRKDFKEVIKGKRHKRTEILADVIKQLEMKKIQPEAGVYCEFTLFNNNQFVDCHSDPKELGAEKDSQLQEFIQKPGMVCNVCAIGSLFIGAVDVNDKLKIKDYGGGSDKRMIHYLKEWFSPTELRLMEYAFEGMSIARHTEMFKRSEDINQFKSALKDQYDYYVDDEITLREIVSNTIKYGEFSPEKGLA